MSYSESQDCPFWLRIPLYLQIAIALVFAVGLGILLGAGQPNPENISLIKNLAIPCDLVLKALRTLATPLILLVVLHSFLTAEIPVRAGRHLAVIIFTNSLVAVAIGLLVANVLQPGKWGRINTPINSTSQIGKTLDPWGLLQDIVPDAILKPLVDNNVLQLIFLALAFGIVLRRLKAEQIAQGKMDYLPLEQIITLLFEAVIRILHWVITLVPLAVFGIVARTVALEGFAPFKSLSGYIVAVLVALFLQACYYLTRVQFGSWVNPKQFLMGGSDALFTAFSTASSTATMPITFEALKKKIGLRESSASLGAFVGSNFNHDGTALYEAMSVLFIAQVLNLDLSLPQQLIVMIASMFASIGAAGMPQAGLVTMTLVFTAVGLPTKYIALLVTVDWFLDRCRTAINVMGDMTVSSLLDGKTRRLDSELSLVEQEDALEANISD